MQLHIGFDVLSVISMQNWVSILGISETRYVSG